MITNYPVGDFLIRVKNAALAEKRDVLVDNNKLTMEVAKILKKEGYLESLNEKEEVLNVRIALKSKKPVISNIKLVSKPGLRIYMGVDELLQKKGPSQFIVSTTQGILLSKEAIKKRLGGEVIAEIL